MRAISNRGDRIQGFLKCKCFQTSNIPGVVRVTTDDVLDRLQVCRPVMPGIVPGDAIGLDSISRSFAHCLDSLGGANHGGSFRTVISFVRNSESRYPIYVTSAGKTV